MAISTSVSIKYKCGHTQSTDLAYVPAGKRKSHAFGLGKNRVCTKCFTKENEAGRAEWLHTKNAEELAEAEVFEESYGLAPITGSEKQLAWGTRSRHKLLATALEELTTGENPPMDMGEFESGILSPARRIVQASWWINNSDAESEDIEELVTTAVDEQIPETENPF